MLQYRSCGMPDVTSLWQLRPLQTHNSRYPNALNLSICVCGFNLERKPDKSLRQEKVHSFMAAADSRHRVDTVASDWKISCPWLPIYVKVRYGCTTMGCPASGFTNINAAVHDATDVLIPQQSALRGNDKICNLINHPRSSQGSILPDKCHFLADGSTIRPVLYCKCKKCICILVPVLTGYVHAVCISRAVLRRSGSAKQSFSTEPIFAVYSMLN